MLHRELRQPKFLFRPLPFRNRGNQLEGSHHGSIFVANGSGHDLDADGIPLRILPPLLVDNPLLSRFKYFLHTAIRAHRRPAVVSLKTIPSHGFAVEVAHYFVGPNRAVVFGDYRQPCSHVLGNHLELGVLQNQLCFGGLALSNVGMGTHEALGPSLAVARYHLASALNPAPFPGFGPETEFDLEASVLLFDMLLDGRHYTRPVIGMQQLQ